MLDVFAPAPLVGTDRGAKCGIVFNGPGRKAYLVNTRLDTDYEKYGFWNITKDLSFEVPDGVYYPEFAVNQVGRAPPYKLNESYYYHVQPPALEWLAMDRVKKAIQAQTQQDQQEAALKSLPLPVHVCNILRYHMHHE